MLSGPVVNRINDNIRELCENPKMVQEITDLLENYAKQKGLQKFEIPRRINLISTASRVFLNVTYIMPW